MSPRTMILSSCILLIFLSLSMYGLFSWSNYGFLVNENRKLRENIRLKNSQMEFLAQRMGEVRNELSEIRSISREIEQELGRSKPEMQGGIGGPVKEVNRRDYQQIVFLNTENDLLDELWTEVEEIEQETILEKEKSNAFSRFLKSRSALLTSIPNMRPIEGGFISSVFGRRRDPFTGSIKMHTGIDLAHSQNVPVYATAEGVVMSSKYSPSYGKVVIVYHGFGLSTLYAHLHETNVKPGEWVGKGQVIGLLGSTGRSTHRHLHYEVRMEGRPVNPYYFLPTEYKG